ncbi:MAG: hypothetical protein ABSA43_02410 [Candidatus Microgenomates bacterium]
MDPNLPNQPIPPAPPSAPPAEPIQPFQPPVPPTPPVRPIQPLVSPPPPVKKVSGVLIAGLVLLFISVLALVGYYFIQTNGLKVNVSTPTASPEPTITVTSTPLPTSDLTNESTTSAIPADWKTYTETRDVKFSIQYPSTWTLNTQDGMHGEKGATFDSGKEIIGLVGIGWNIKNNEINCSLGTIEQVQLSNQTIEMCHTPGSTQEPEGYFYNGVQNGITYSITTSNYPGVDKRNMILKILSTLKI